MSLCQSENTGIVSVSFLGRTTILTQSYPRTVCEFGLYATVRSQELYLCLF